MLGRGKKKLQDDEGASLVAFYMSTYYRSNYHTTLVTDIDYLTDKISHFLSTRLSYNT
jgi:hypothetical protein